MVNNSRGFLNELVSLFDAFMLVVGMGATAYMFYYLNNYELTKETLLLISMFYLVIKAVFVLTIIIIPAIMGYRLMLSGGSAGEAKLFLKKSIVRLVVLVVWTCAFLFVEPDSVLGAGELINILF